VAHRLSIGPARLLLLLAIDVGVLSLLTFTTMQRSEKNKTNKTNKQTKKHA
jgi:hypothetical protein